MLDYEWGNPQSTVMINAGDDQPTPDSDQPRHSLDHYAAQAFNETLLHSSNNFPQNNNYHPHHHQQNHNLYHHHQQPHPQMHSLYDPRAFYPPPMPSLDSVIAGGCSSGYMLMPKAEPSVDYATRIGLNLGGRTYFSSSEDDFVNRLYRRSRSDSSSINSPRCQAEGCNADLTHSKHYHRRHKVCEYHSKASTVIAAGLTQRFCQQCSRFHLLSEFDNGKRSCRKRLADHNRRRRKSNQQSNPEQKPNLEIGTASSSDTVTRSPAESAAQSTSSVTVAISPPRISLECFRQGSPSRHSLFFSNG